MITDFAAPFWLLLLWAIPLFLVWYFGIYKHRRLRIQLSYDPNRLVKRRFTWAWIRFLPLTLFVTAAVLMIIALARPQKANDVSLKQSSGIDILLALDVSESMQTPDFDPSRLEVAKETAIQFINGRKDDRIGLVLFAEDAFSYSPLTLDYDLLKTLIRQMNPSVIPRQGTAMGDAVAIGINRLKSVSGKSRVLIVLTDGVSNNDRVDPVSAARLAAEYGIKIYTIGVGKPSYIDGKGKLVKTDLDEETLKQMAEVTGGGFYRATDERSLSVIFARISTMERTAVNERVIREVVDLYPLYLQWAVICMALAILLTYLGIQNGLEE